MVGKFGRVNRRSRPDTGGILSNSEEGTSLVALAVSSSASRAEIKEDRQSMEKAMEVCSPRGMCEACAMCTSGRSTSTIAIPESCLQEIQEDKTMQRLGREWRFSVAKGAQPMSLMALSLRRHTRGSLDGEEWSEKSRD